MDNPGNDSEKDDGSGNDSEKDNGSGNDSEKDDGSGNSNILAIVLGIIAGVAIIVIIVMCCVITTYCCLRYVAINHIFLCQYAPVRINTLLICLYICKYVYKIMQ